MVDLRNKHIALLAKWPFLIKTDQYLEMSAYNSLSVELGENIWMTNLKTADINTLFSETFWKYVLIAWCKCTHIFPMTYQEVALQMIWFNSYVKCGGKPFLLQKLFLAGCIYMRDLISEKDVLFIYEELPLRYKNAVTCLEYQGLLNAIPHCWKNILVNNVNINERYCRGIIMPQSH